MVFFFVSGLGYGNAARQIAIIREFKKRSPQCPVTAFSWGLGYKKLSQLRGLDLFNVKPLWYRMGTTKSYTLSIILSTAMFLVMYPLNIVRILVFVFALKPRVAVFDSDYHLPVFLPFSIRRISINQAADVLKKSGDVSWRSLAKAGYLGSFLLEWLDSIFQKSFASRVLVPSLTEKVSQEGNSKLTWIPLIVRGEFRHRSREIFKSRGPAVLCGGSGLGSESLIAWANKSDAKIFQNVSGEAGPEGLLLHYDPILLQGGLSSISECLALGKFLNMLPIVGHFEQFVNAREVEKKGYGKVLKADLSNLEIDIKEKSSLPDSFFSGAECAAEIIQSEMRETT